MMQQLSAEGASTLLDLWRNTAPLAFIATCGFAWRVSSRLVKIETLLRTIGGETGTNGELGKLKATSHQMRDSMQGMETELALHKQRLDAGGI